MTRQEAIERLELVLANCSSNIWDEGYTCEECRMNCDEAIKMAIDALEQIESGRYIKGECDLCSKEYGTLGCCTTVSNHWVYSCKEGMVQYAAMQK